LWSNGATDYQPLLGTVTAAACHADSTTVVRLPLYMVLYAALCYAV